MTGGAVGTLGGGVGMTGVVVGMAGGAVGMARKAVGKAGGAVGIAGGAVGEFLMGGVGGAGWVRCRLIQLHCCSLGLSPTLGNSPVRIPVSCQNNFLRPWGFLPVSTVVL